MVFVILQITNNVKLKAMKNVLLILTLCVGMVACSGGKTKSVAENQQTKKDVVEVLYFHGTQRCKSCVEAERIVQSVLAEQYTEAIEQGKLRYRTIDIINDEDIANEYEVVWSSLLLVDYDTNGERIIEDLTDVAFLNADRLSIELSNRIATMLNN
jgi:hypothetical protein